MATATLEREVMAGVEDDRLGHHEIIDGVRQETPRMGIAEVVFANLLARRIIVWMDRTIDLGQVLVEVLFRLHPNGRHDRRPDLSFVSYERWAKDQPIPSGDAWAVVPELAVEVISPSNTGAAILKKIKTYFRRGVRLVWVIHPDDQIIFVYRSLRDIRALQRSDGLDGGDVLPGFSIPMAELFPHELADEDGPDDE